jgi:hypothetical protein
MAESSLEDAKLGRAVAMGLPVLTLTIAAVAGVVVGPALSILVIAAGMLLGVIAILWASLRVLSGDTPLSPELAALEIESAGVDALSSRKKMLLRALKDLETEHGLGKLDDSDYEPIAANYRGELKALMRRMDETLSPHRAKAEELLREHLLREGLASGERGSTSAPVEKPTRLVCPSCDASNELDAKFCKECAARLLPASTSTAEVANEPS